MSLFFFHYHRAINFACVFFSSSTFSAHSINTTIFLDFLEWFTRGEQYLTCLSIALTLAPVEVPLGYVICYCHPDWRMRCTDLLPTQLQTLLPFSSFSLLQYLQNAEQPSCGMSSLDSETLLRLHQTYAWHFLRAVRLRHNTRIFLSTEISSVTPHHLHPWEHRTGNFSAHPSLVQCIFCKNIMQKLTCPVVTRAQHLPEATQPGYLSLFTIERFELTKFSNTVSLRTRRYYKIFALPILLLIAFLR